MNNVIIKIIALALLPTAIIFILLRHHQGPSGDHCY